jgi:ADP-heptose:LPS heptosyltransferase/GT2 family glycosyltransferase
MKFSISILAVNGVSMTKRCIDSVLDGGGDFEILLTDNASTDGTAHYFDQLAAGNPHVSVVHNTENKGFSEPNNEALTRAKGEYFITLNNDTEVPPGWLDLLEAPFKKFPTAAISGPAGSCCTLRENVGGFLGDLGSNYEYVEGSCLCIPIKLARKYTLFAPYMHFAYGEDLDLSLRMRARGLTVHQVPFRIVHHRSMTARGMTFPAGVHEHNQRMLRDRWGNYLSQRRFDLPIIIHRQAALGDVLLTTPLIRALRDQQPQSKIYFESACGQVLLNNPHVRVAPPRQQFSPNIRALARHINLDMSYENMPQTHIVDAYFKKALIIPSEPGYRHTENYFTLADEEWAASSLIGAEYGSERWVAVHPGPSTWRGKQWPMERFHQLCGWLRDNKWNVVLVGSSPHPSMPRALDLRGKTTCQQLGTVIKRCSFMVSIDSYPLHVAESVGVPVIGLFGITRPEFIMTRFADIAIAGEAACAGDRHRPIFAGKTHIPCDGACVDNISIHQVVAAVEKLTQ